MGSHFHDKHVPTFSPGSHTFLASPFPCIRFIFIHLYVCVATRVHVLEEAEVGIRYPGDRIVGDCEPAWVLGTELGFLWKSSQCSPLLNHLSLAKLAFSTEQAALGWAALVSLEMPLL